MLYVQSTKKQLNNQQSTTAFFAVALNNKPTRGNSKKPSERSQLAPEHDKNENDERQQHQLLEKEKLPNNKSFVGRWPPFRLY